MPQLSWIIASNRRHQLLAAVIQHIHLSTPPEGWTYDVIVGVDADDKVAVGIVEANNAKAVLVGKRGGGPKRNAAARQTRANLLLIADDDDIPSAARACLAVKAHQKGCKVTSTREYRFLHLPSGMVVRYRGRELSPGNSTGPIVGTARNIERTIFEHVGMFKDLKNQLDSDLQRRMHRRFRIHDRDLATVLGSEAEVMWTSTVCVQHGRNTWTDRPELGKGETQVRGGYKLLGEGHWSELADFPPTIAPALGLT